MVTGSYTSQRNNMVVSSANTSNTAVSASGINTMSDSSIPRQPAMDEPSNIFPETKNSSLMTLEGRLTCCSLPRVSVKRRSTNLTPFSSIMVKTSDTFIAIRPPNAG